MLIKYGIKDNNIDVTNICKNKLLIDDYIIIPAGDLVRGSYFTDPLVGVFKFVFVIDDENNITEFDFRTPVYIDTKLNKCLKENIPESVLLLNIDNKLANIHSKLKLHNGYFSEEFPEQRMAIKYLTGHEKVLEIGGNIGRVSLIISYILSQKNNRNHLVLECDTNIAEQLKENRDLNNFHFQIENSALSKRELIQKGWLTIVSDTLLEDYTRINTITYEELVKKYNIRFDTLILDCEGAFYYILQDMPEILENIHLIIMENDYSDIAHKEFVDSVLKSKNFVVDYTECGGWGVCYNKFYEVWKKSFLDKNCKIKN